MTKFVENITTGVRHRATTRLVKLTKRRADLRVVEVDDEEPQSSAGVSDSTPGPVRKKRAKKKASKKKASKKVAAKKGEKPGKDSVVQQIMSLRGKDAIEEVILENYGVDLDKRLTLEKLKEQALDIVAKADAGEGGE